LDGVSCLILEEHKRKDALNQMDLSIS
jgi:hypothetical protein